MSGLWKHARPYLVVALLGAPLIWPLLRQAVPCTHDGQLYYYQTAALQHGFANSLIYSRWLPDAALGYGIPLFNYREPLPRYLLAGLAETGLPVPLALNLTMALCLLVTGLGSYRLARDVFQDEVAGLLSGAAAMAAPYLLLDIYRRGALPECAALALTPWVWWAFWRIGQGHHKRAPILAAVLWAALILTHNISALLMAPALLGYAALLAYLAADRPRELLSPRRWLRPLTGFLGGVGLAAFYWIPAFFEKDLIQIGAAVSTRNNSYRFNFVGLGDLLAAPAAHNTALLNPPLRITLGLPLALLAAVGLVGGWLVYRDRSRRVH
ncbi:MAG: 6-pyruvoyl-tetrahydropterin synthase-related protein, partial [Chloroflexota bacterium]